jgi:hypothetical protein
MVGYPIALGGEFYQAKHSAEDALQWQLQPTCAYWDSSLLP